MKNFIKKILVPVDGSPSSRKALDQALAVAEQAGAHVTVLEVVEDFGPLPGYYEAAPTGKDRVKWISEQRFEKVHPALDHTKVKWDRKVATGYPADEICKLAAEGKYDLIMIGSRGHSAIARFLVGSVSDRVVHHAPCTVAVVR